jgi:hypothetical protein
MFAAVGVDAGGVDVRGFGAEAGFAVEHPVRHCCYLQLVHSSSSWRRPQVHLQPHPGSTGLEPLQSYADRS